MTVLPPDRRPAVLYLGIMVHLEGWSDQTDRTRFEQHVRLMREYADLFEAYGAKLTWESKEVTEGILRWGDNVLREMEQRGHGIGVHADIGGERSYDCSRFAADLRAKKVQLESLGVTVRHVSGIVSHCDWVTAAAEAGYLFTTGQVAYSVMSLPAELRPPAYRNCPNPSACHQTFPADLADRLHPWRMNSGADWLTHNQQGRLVMLPSSQVLPCMEEELIGTDARNCSRNFTGADIDYFIRQLEQAIALAEPDRVNTYYVGWSLGAALDTALLEEWLKRIVPYVQSGQVQWKTLPEMYDAYVQAEASIAREVARPGEDPRTAAPPTQAAASTPSLLPNNRPCGDGVCEGPENARNCPADCALTPGPSDKGGKIPLTPDPSAIGKGEHYTVINPADGANLAVYVTTPPQSGGSLQPAVVLVPGGSGDSSSFRRPRSEAEAFAQAGYIVVVFDPDGRGQSGGREDYNGFIQQDGLAAVIRFAATLPGVDPSRIGLVTYSYGITMGAGALARHPDLPIAFLIDWEGPADRNDTGGCAGAVTGHLQRVASCSDEAFWAQREAGTFIGQIRVPYQRIQSEKDHVQPDNTHAILMVNNAVAGGVPWVRLNDLPPNQTYDPTHPPAMLTEEASRLLIPLVLDYIKDMFALHK